MRIVLLLILTAGLGGCWRRESSRLDAILACKILRVGTTGDYRPYSYVSPKGRVGIDIELAQDLADSLGARLELIPTSWGQLMKDLQGDKFDIALSGISRTLERQRVALFSQEYSPSGKTPLARCSDKQKFNSLPRIDAEGVKVIVNPGGTNEKFAKQTLKKAKLVVHSDGFSVFDELLAGRADVMITDQEEVRIQSRLHPSLCGTMPETTFDPQGKAVLLSRDIVLKEYIDAWLSQVKRNGTLARVVQKHLDELPVP